MPEPTVRSTHSVKRGKKKLITISSATCKAHYGFHQKRKREREREREREEISLQNIKAENFVHQARKIFSTK